MSIPMLRSASASGYGRGPVGAAPPDLGRDPVPVELTQDVRRRTGGRVGHREQQVLGIDVLVVQLPRCRLGARHHIARRLREPAHHHRLRSPRADRRSRPACFLCTACRSRRARRRSAATPSPPGAHCRPGRTSRLSSSRPRANTPAGPRREWCSWPPRPALSLRSCCQSRLTTPTRQPKLTSPGWIRWCDRGCAVGVEGLDGLQAPGLTLGALGLGPGDDLPVGGEQQAGPGVAQLDAVAARLPDVQEERLLDRVLVRARSRCGCRASRKTSAARRMSSRVSVAKAMWCRRPACRSSPRCRRGRTTCR